MRGFDAAQQRFVYQVNERFGSTAASRSTALRQPFQIGLTARLQLGPDREREMLQGFLRGGGQGGGGRGGPGGGGFDVATMMERVAPDPVKPVLDRRDSLQLTNPQVAALTALADSFRLGRDSLVASLQADAAAAGTTGNDLGAMFQRLQPKLQQARNDYLAAVQRFRQVLFQRNALLRQGLVILDTPGLNAIGTEPELTLNLIPQAHAVLFILAADTGVTKRDIEVWREHIGAGAGRLVVLNKIDGMWDALRSEEEVEGEIVRQQDGFLVHGVTHLKPMTLRTVLPEALAATALCAPAGTVRILGIDPGLRRTGWGVIACEGNRLAFVDCGTVTSNEREPLAIRIGELAHAGRTRQRRVQRERRFAPLQG